MREALTALTGILAIPVVAAPAAGAAPNPGVRATYNGRTINLADGWQGAHACGVFGPDNVVCFDTREQLHDVVAIAARAGTARRAKTAMSVTPASSCGGSSTECNFSAVRTGVAISSIFVSTSGFFDLADYGFDNDMESWASSKTCNVICGGRHRWRRRHPHARRRKLFIERRLLEESSVVHFRCALITRELVQSHCPFVRHHFACRRIRVATDFSSTSGKVWVRSRTLHWRDVGT